ncbi:MAG: hypothetical protein WDN31_19635 [Hyphomicrobium sp.]
MFIIFIFLGIALRSVLVGVASIMPSLFPIFATGAILWATGEGLQFASIVAITVAFSLAIDSTIHFLKPLPPGGGQAGRHAGDGLYGPHAGGASHRSARGDHHHRAGDGPRRDDAVAPAVAAAVRRAGRRVPLCLADRAARHPAGGADGRAPAAAAPGPSRRARRSRAGPSRPRAFLLPCFLSKTGSHFFRKHSRAIVG